ncbi:CpaF family protein [Acidibrevibacterium fodinaquatile]|uniref:CpaF family protein n=1 Tax=Acidibrevibacterium fodinaquatile TaxID=1969806 RepID=UPI000E0DC4D6|nr:CpaF family protein [Acidibrevibacterium fodinaquatile]
MSETVPRGVMFGRRRATSDAAPASTSAEPTPALPDTSLGTLRSLCLEQLDPAAAAGMPQEKLAQAVERLIAEIATERRIQLNAREQRELAFSLVDDMLGHGPLQPLLEDEAVTDIMVNGPTRVFVERGGKLMLSAVRFRDAGHVANICQRIAAAVGRRIDEASPMVDARLADGSRVNIVFPPLALDGPYLSIRKFAKKKIDFPKLIEFGSLTAPVARVLEIASRIRLNVIISGGTGSGKTTLLNAMSRLIDGGERIVTIEDAAELQLQQPHVVRLETRPASLEGRGEINQRDLVRNALRMRPDRIIVGEVRSGEAFDMLQAMNTGHDGSMSTVHANTTRDALTRIESMVQMGNIGLPARAIRTQIVSAIDLIVQVERQRDGGRRVLQVSEVCGMEGDVVTMNDIFLLEVEGEGLDGRLRVRYRVSRARPNFHDRLSYFGLERAWTTALDEAERG